MKNQLSTEENNALVDLVASLGVRKTKSAIRQAWMTGGYRNEGIFANDDVFQRMRNRDGGREALDKAVLRSLRRIDVNLAA